MLLAISMVVLGQPLHIFNSTISPSKRWAVAYRDPGKGEPKTLPDDEPTVDELVDLRTKRTVAKLTGFHAFPGENHGGMHARYTKGEEAVVFMRAGKWEPRGLLIISTHTGAQADLLKQVNLDAASYFKAHHRTIAGRPFAYDVGGVYFVGKYLEISVIGQVPKAEDLEPVYVEIDYPYSAKKGVALGKPSFKPLSGFPKWIWNG